MEYIQTNNKKPAWLFFPGWVVLNNIIIVLAWYITWALMTQLVNIIGGRIEIGGAVSNYRGFFVYLPVASGNWFISRLCSVYTSSSLFTTDEVVDSCNIFELDYAFSYGSLITNFLGTTNNIILIMLGMVLIGASLALPQWWMLRQRVRFAYWWILAYGLGWGMIGILALVTTEPFAFLLAMALVPNLTTGITLWLLLDGLPRLKTKRKFIVI